MAITIDALYNDFLAYAATALFSSSEYDSDRTLDRIYTVDDIAPETKEAMMKDIDIFWTIVAANEDVETGLYCHDSDDVMHNFWLTRNGHGAGFWDGRFEDTLGKRLTTIAKSFGQFSLTVGKDGLIHHKR